MRATFKFSGVASWKFIAYMTDDSVVVSTSWKTGTSIMFSVHKIDNFLEYIRGVSTPTYLNRTHNQKWPARQPHFTSPAKQPSEGSADWLSGQRQGSAPQPPGAKMSSLWYFAQYCGGWRWWPGEQWRAGWAWPQWGQPSGGLAWPGKQLIRFRKPANTEYEKIKKKTRSYALLLGAIVLIGMKYEL